MKQLDGKSLDIVSQNIEKIKELFPEVFSEGKINFAKLQEELGTFAEDEAERYNFTWAGKSEAKRIAQTPSTGTLRPCKEESKDWDTTQNLYIEGDNLEVLKLLQKSYHKQVKMIYIDPPYNTGKDFVYKDNFKDNIKNYLEITGQVDSEGNRLSTNSDTNGRYHSDWLSMMYPRLKLARNLLKDDGVIFISIDDNEVANLRKLCDEIFGEDNSFDTIVWKKRYQGAKEKHLVGVNEYILFYAKNKENIGEILVAASDEYIKTYFTNKDEKFELRGGYRTQPLEAGKSMDNRDNLKFKINAPDGTYIYPKRQWVWSLDRVDEALKNGEIGFSKNQKGEYTPFIKQYLKDENGIIRKTKKQTLIDNVYTQNGTKEMYELFEDLNVFSFPKPTNLLMQLLDIGNIQEGETILDFFSGSATTAHAVMKLNSEDGGNRKFICVQLPETTDEKSEAYKAGYKNICEIGKERLRRAGEKIKTDNADKDLSNLDIGFKVLKLDSSNIKTWDSNFDNLEQNLLESIENIKSDRTAQDLLYEILLKYGLDLTLPIEEKTIHAKKVFVIGYGALIVCLDDKVTLEVVEAIAQLKDEYKSEITRVVFKDSSFADAVVKTNAIQVLKQLEIDEVVSV